MDHIEGPTWTTPPATQKSESDRETEFRLTSYKNMQLHCPEEVGGQFTVPKAGPRILTPCLVAVIV
jgi:hypothetical protein